MKNKISHSFYYNQSSKFFIKLILAYFLICFFNFNLKAQISGYVFRDFNENGVKDSSSTFLEVRLPGVIVNAYNSSNVLVGTTTTSPVGTYSFTGLTLPLRIEFTGLISGDYSSPVSTTSTSNKSSVQFYSASSTDANFGVNYPDHYISKIDPDYVVSQFEANRPSASIPDANAMLIQSYSARGKDFAPSIASTAEIGGTWGITYDRKED
ncbi:MAG: hypothetical protein IPL95_09280 [Saprospiraceae bacterium]|nr:hypothetical protein [Saprospiraceae bacterium]